jgi:hypothetical protein
MELLGYPGQGKKPGHFNPANPPRIRKELKWNYQHSECCTSTPKRDSRPFPILARVPGQGIPSSLPLVPKY